MPVLDAAAAAAFLDALTLIAARAADAVRRTGDRGGVRRKSDGSPVTAADETSDAVIRAELAVLAPAVPIISEEHAPDRAAGGDASYFLVDPLDGTREFIAGRDEYTVNIALMTEAAPLLGVIAAPALGLIWRGIVGRGAERLAVAADGSHSSPATIRTRPLPPAPIALVSRSHLDARTLDYIAGLPGTSRLACGSSLKFCRVAEGSADLYPRLAPTHDWDVAAGHAIVAAAGGSVRAPGGGSIRYGSADLLIGAFIASGRSGA